MTNTTRPKPNVEKAFLSLNEAAEEIERLRSDRDHFKADWRAMIDQTDNLEHALKNARKALKELNE